jgi:antitoxin VapB
MPIQIANPKVVARIERLSAACGLTKTAAVEKAVDAMLADRQGASDDEFEARAFVILCSVGSNSGPRRCV